MVLALLASIGTFVSAQESPATPDAALRAIHMASAKEGWAVGDDGLVLHTVDGWQTWEQQRTNVRVMLRAVHFVDAFVGYVGRPRTVTLQPRHWRRGAQNHRWWS